MMVSRTARVYPFSDMKISVQLTKESEESEKLVEKLVITFGQKTHRIVKLQYADCSAIKLMSMPCIHVRMSQVVQLNLQLNKIDNKGCKMISAVELPRLKTLNLSCNNITGVGMIHLAKSRFGRESEGKLSLLYLANNKIWEGIYWLGKIQCSLRLLNIEGCSLTTKTILPFFMSQYDRLGHLMMLSNLIEKKTTDMLKVKYPAVQFYL